MSKKRTASIKWYERVLIFIRKHWIRLLVGISIIFLLILLALVACTAWMTNLIVVTMTAPQAANLPLTDEPLGSDGSKVEKRLMDPVEYNGELLSGYNKVSFETNDGLYAQYEGYLEDGLFNGQGAYTVFFGGTNTAEFTYNGEWKDSQVNGGGTAIFYHKDGTAIKYDGIWKDSGLEGTAISTEYYEDGTTIKSVLDGTWRNNSLSGPGTLTEYYEDGITVKFVYDGMWKDNTMNGQGTIKKYYEDGKTTKYAYNGTWKDSRVEGQGIATEFYEDGTKIKWEFSSQWKSIGYGNGAFVSVPDGVGTFVKYDPNGSILTSGTTTASTEEYNIDLTTFWDTSTADKATMDEFTAFWGEIQALVSRADEGVGE